MLSAGPAPGISQLGGSLGPLTARGPPKKKFSKPHLLFHFKYESLKYTCDYSTLRLKRHWFGVNNNFIYPLNGAPDQIQNVICLNRASLIIQNGLWIDV